MNPIDVENAMKAALTTPLSSLSPAPTLHTSVTAQDIDQEKQAVIVQMESGEYVWNAFAQLTIAVSVRTPAQVFTLSQHSAVVQAVSAAIRNTSTLVSAFNSASTSCNLVSWAGSSIAQVRYATPQFEDNAWINSMSFVAGATPQV